VTIGMLNLILSQSEMWTPAYCKPLPRSLDPFARPRIESTKHYELISRLQCESCHPQWRILCNHVRPLERQMAASSHVSVLSLVGRGPNVSITLDLQGRTGDFHLFCAQNNPFLGHELDSPFSPQCGNERGSSCVTLSIIYGGDACLAGYCQN
jgi:hypothetical protein